MECVAPATQDCHQLWQVFDGRNKLWQVVADQPCSFGETDTLVLPCRDKGQPVLHNDRRQLGIKLRHLPYRIVGAMLFQQVVRLPELEQQLDLPAKPIEHDDFLPTQQIVPARREKNRPVAGGQVPCAGLPTFLRRFVEGFLSTAVRHFFGSAQCYQPATKSYLPNLDPAVDRAGRLRVQPIVQVVRLSIDPAKGRKFLGKSSVRWLLAKLEIAPKRSNP